MVEALVVAEWGPQTAVPLEPGIEYEQTDHRWKIFIFQCLWLILAIICHRYIHKFTNEARMLVRLRGDRNDVGQNPSPQQSE